MADHRDEIMEALAYQISRVYTMLVDVCGALPVPIGLPTDQHIPATEAVPAIQRAAALASDQPMVNCRRDSCSPAASTSWQPSTSTHCAG